MDRRAPDGRRLRLGRSLSHEDLWLEISGLRYHLDLWDGGGETTVLFLHGFLDLGRTWTLTVEALGDCDWHIVAPDWRGHGDTQWVGAGGYYHFADYIRDLEQIVAAVRRERLIIVGHSMGAGALALWAGARPEAMNGAVLVDWPGPVPSKASDYPGRMARFLDQTAPFDRERAQRPMRDQQHAADRIRRADHRLDEATALRLAGFAAKPVDSGWAWKYDPLHRTRAPVPFMPAIAAAFWQRISCPIWWIGGGESPFVRPELTGFLDTLPQLERKLVAGAGHMVQNDAPEALARHLREFVRAL